MKEKNKARRKIIKIEEELCDGCGLCVPACAEGALAIVDGKAKLVSEVYCDGLGACLGECPNSAIVMEEREAYEFDEEAVKKYILTRTEGKSRHGRVQESYHVPIESTACRCPGSSMKVIKEPDSSRPGRTTQPEHAAHHASRNLPGSPISHLSHWPVQLMLVPPGAPFLAGSDILLCADCVPFVVPDFHDRYLRGRSVLVCCPKLDDLEYYKGKLVEIISIAEPRSITVLRMEVPCCGGLTWALVEAAEKVGNKVDIQVHTLGIEKGCKVEYYDFTASGRIKAATE